MKAQIKSKKMNAFFRLSQSLRAQVKIQEMAFVLLALALLAGIVFIFVLRFQAGNIEKSGELVKQAEAISLLEKIASLPELNCEKGKICIDYDKASIASQNQDKLRSLFQNIKKAQIRKINSNEQMIIYQLGAGNETYSTFISICSQNKIGTSFEWSCEIGQLELTI